MRWTDLPPDRDPADGGVSELTQGQWQDLRERLERLPPGHPSRPDEAGEAGEAGLAGDDAADQDAPDDDEKAPGQGVQDGDARRGRAPGAPGEAGGHRTRDAGRAVTGGAREPYRPWFTAGEPPEPWFSAGKPPEPWFAADQPE
jgi:hypothetical protein